jgi:hypothetical protein
MALTNSYSSSLSTGGKKTIILGRKMFKMGIEVKKWEENR